MKHICLFIICLLLAEITLEAQVAINKNGNNPDASAMLDVRSTDAGMLIPRMTAIQRDVISAPATGLLVFVTDDSNFYFFNGTVWKLFSGGSDSDWIINGNDLYSSVTGNVGIGTTTPQADLHVAGSGQFHLEGPAADIYFINTSGSKTGRINYDGNGDLMFLPNSTVEVMRMKNNGNIGIGTASPSSKLDISNGGINSAEAMLTLQSGADQFKIVDVGDGDYGIIGNDNNGSYFKTVEGASGITGAEIHLTNNGNVGFGTSSPDHILHAMGSGDQYLQVESSTNDNAGIRFIRTSSTNGDWMIYNNNGNLRFGFDNDLLSNSPTDLLNIEQNTGNVGIGTNSPNEKLEVNGHIRMTDGNQGAGKFMVSDANGTASWTDVSLNDNDWTINGNDMYSAVSGNVGIGTTTPGVGLVIDKDGSNAGIHLKKAGSNVAVLASGSSSPGTGNEQGLLELYHDGNMNIRLYSTGDSWINPTSGNMGIGTTTPQADLHVAGNGQFHLEGPAADIYFINTSGSKTGRINYDGNGDLTFLPNSTIEVMRMKNNGNIGIGTASPSSKLDISNGGINSAEAVLTLQSGADQFKIIDVGDGDYGIIGNDNSGSYFKTVEGASGITGAEIHLTNNGNVGFGTSSPDHILHTMGSGNQYLQVESSSNNDAGIRFIRSNAANGDWMIYNNNGNLRFGFDNDLPSNTPTDYLSIQQNTGYLGVGTTSPWARLDVAGNIRSAHNATAGDIYFGTDNKGRISYDSNNEMEFLTNGSEQMRIDENGYVGIGTNNPGELLDVNGAMHLTPGSAPSNPDEGDIYMDASSHKLRCYDGSVWRDLW